MWLITVQEWHGPRETETTAEKPGVGARQSLEGFVWQGALCDGIRRLKAYADARNAAQKQAAWDFNVVAVVEIDPLPDDVLEAGDIRRIDQLPMTLAEFANDLVAA